MAALVRTVYADDALTLGHADSAMITVVRANLQANHYRQVHKLTQELVRRWEGRMSSVLVVRSRLRDLPRVDDEQRRMAREIMAMGGERTVGAVAAIEGGGFWGASVRGILTGICLLARPPFPWRIVDDSADAARWLAARSAAAAQGPGEAALLDAVGQMVAYDARASHAA
jgi:hypothetical protein